MKNEIILSICIPTYNRAEKLQQCLENIICQFKNDGIENLIEVVISDNASIDNTTEIVKKFQESFNNIKYFRNEKNIGMDENIINSVVKANGKYCWHIGDDDFIQNGVLEFLVDFLSKKEVALLTVNFHPFIDIRKSLEKDNNINQRFIIYSDSPVEFYKMGYCQGILGIFIFNRALWMKVDRKNYEEFWSYYEIILKMLPASHLPLAYLSYPVLFIGQDYNWNKNGAALFTALHVKKLFDKLRNFGYDGNFIDSEINGFAKKLPATVVAAKAADLKCTFDNLSLIYKEFYQYPIPLFLTTLVFFIPNHFIKILKNINNTLRTKRV